MSRIEALLLDLDGTLLDLDIEAFLPHYLAALAPWISPWLEPGDFIRHLLASTGAMMANTDPARTNQDVFMADFFGRTGLDPAELLPVFDRFYREAFPKLAVHARRLPAARRLVEAARSRGRQLVIATNPLYPEPAIRERMRWAGVDDFPYALVTSYEHMHACKPHAEYFLEILERLGAAAGRPVPPEACLMVGDDPQRDLPASAVGIRTWYVVRDGSEPAPEIRARADGWGRLEDLLARVEAGGLDDGRLRAAADGEPFPC